jgi:hypothetical protein
MLLVIAVTLGSFFQNFGSLYKNFKAVNNIRESREMTFKSWRHCRENYFSVRPLNHERWLRIYNSYPQKEKYH